MEADGDGDEEMCRYCFEGNEAGELISPCNCIGGQKYVHLSCLRRWQRMVLVSQPTHPAFYDRDVRHHTCNVCQAEFTCAPPTRHELMESFTGPELGALIDVGCIIASEEVVSREMERELEPLPPPARERSGSRHWIRGVYLITGVEEDDGKLQVPVADESYLASLRARLGPEHEITARGRRYRLAPGGSLEGVREEDLREAFANLRTPATICLAPAEPPNCGDDHIAAVNLARPLDQALRPLEVRSQVDYVCAKYPGARSVEVTHYIGGPCDPDEIVSCVVPGGTGRGWTVVKDLRDAVQLAHSRAAKRTEAQGSVAGGQTVRLTGLQSQPQLNGEAAVNNFWVGFWELCTRCVSGKALLAAESLFRSEQFYYQTGIEVPFLRPMSVWVNASYRFASHSPRPATPGEPRGDVLVHSRGRLKHEVSFVGVLRNMAGRAFPFRIVTQGGRIVPFKELAGMHAVAILPWSPEICMLRHLFKMRVPLFVPDRNLLVNMVHISNQRLLPFPYYHHIPHHDKEAMSAVHPYDPFLDTALPPADVRGMAARAYWAEYSEYLLLPCLQHFRSAAELLAKLHAMEPTRISAQMAAAHAQDMEEMASFWTETLTTMLAKP